MYLYYSQALLSDRDSLQRIGGILIAKECLNSEDIAFALGKYCLYPRQRLGLAKSDNFSQARPVKNRPKSRKFIASVSVLKGSCSPG